jgi:hypothetical protein
VRYGTASPTYNVPILWRQRKKSPYKCMKLGEGKEGRKEGRKEERKEERKKERKKERKQNT